MAGLADCGTRVAWLGLSDGTQRGQKQQWKDHPHNTSSIALQQPGPVAIDARNAIEWTAQFGEAGATHFRNGPSRARQARNAITRLVEEGVAPADQGELDLMAWFLALAEHTARHYGDRVLALVKTVALAISELVDEVLARPRNLGIDITFDPARLVSGLGRVAARVGIWIPDSAGASLARRRRPASTAAARERPARRRR